MKRRTVKPLDLFSAASKNAAPVAERALEIYHLADELPPDEQAALIQVTAYYITHGAGTRCFPKRPPWLGLVNAKLIKLQGSVGESGPNYDQDFAVPSRRGILVALEYHLRALSSGSDRVAMIRVSTAAFLAKSQLETLEARFVADDIKGAL